MRFPTTYLLLAFLGAAAAATPNRGTAKDTAVTLGGAASDTPTPSETMPPGSDDMGVDEEGDTTTTVGDTTGKPKTTPDLLRGTIRGGPQKEIGVDKPPLKIGGIKTYALERLKGEDADKALAILLDAKGLLEKNQETVKTLIAALTPPPLPSGRKFGFRTPQIQKSAQEGWRKDRLREEKKKEAQEAEQRLEKLERQDEANSDKEADDVEDTEDDDSSPPQPAKAG